MTTNSSDIKYRAQVAEKNLDRIIEWVSRCDYKSSIILGIDTGMLGAMAAFAMPFPDLSLFIIITAFITLLTLGTSLAFIITGIYPRTKDPGKSLLYFEAISNCSLDEYKQRFIEIATDEYVSDLLEQCHRNSEILSQKFHRLKLAFLFLIISVLPWSMSIYLFSS
ncbi:MAG: hypothetical protein AMJ70_07030 [Dehalococcoidia bacterium SG8_51_3]|nr:MAG: hypothetical protein AMJ70_07030 [Dehalococcoidia bacterium SG8_51_3]